MLTWAKVRFGVGRPDLLVRKLRGLEIIDIGLDEIAKFLPTSPIIVEAGALDGIDTARMARRWPSGLIHAFEPVPEAYEQVAQRVSGLANVRTYSVAVSDRVGIGEMHVSSHADGSYRPDSSSLLNPTGHIESFPYVAFDRTIEVPLTTLDQWATDAGVSSVDFLWLDLQGMEIRALQASPRVLASAGAVCLEVARSELYEGSPMYAQVVSWMREQGFIIKIDRVGPTFGNILFTRK